MIVHVCVHRHGDTRAGHAFIFEVEAPNGLQHKMGSMYHGMLLVVSEPTLPGRFDHQRCRPFRISPSNRAQIAMTAMLSAVCAISCPQAQITLPPVENHPKLQGTELSEPCRCRSDRIWGGPRVLAHCICGDTCLEVPFVCRVLPCTSDATARDVLGCCA